VCRQAAAKVHEHQDRLTTKQPTKEVRIMATEQGTTAVDAKKLQGAIHTMDCLSQSAFSDITAIATLALSYIEHAGVDGAWRRENLVRALNIIRNRALDAENCINVEAENVGCNYSERCLPAPH